MAKSGKHKSRVPGTLDTTEADKSTPKSIIVYRGEVGAHVRALMHEWRNVFLPWSSKKLHGKNRSLKDFLVIASTFAVSHLQLFTAPSHGTLLRIMRFAHGPTLTFRVCSFSLRKDIVQNQRRVAALTQAVWHVAPVVVLNNFTHPSLRHRPEVPLLEETFKALYPSVNIHTIQNSDVQRVCLFHYDHTQHVVEARHYYVDARATGVRKTIKKLMECRRPTKLGTLDNLDDVLDQEDGWSDTDGEGEEVTLAQPFRQHRHQCRVKLQEIGPRMTLQLIKVENGFANGEVIYHALQTKTAREVQANAARVHRQKTEKARRKSEQDANVDRKRARREEKIASKRARREAAMRAQTQNPFEVAGEPAAAAAGTSFADDDEAHGSEMDGYAGDMD